MKQSEIFIQTIADVSGRPRQEIEEILASFRRANPAGNWDKEIPEAEAQKLLSTLRGEAPGILRWLVEGAAEVARHKGNA
jgi:hypothetical protein